MFSKRNPSTNFYLNLQGLRNDFQEAMEKVDQDYLDNILFSNTKSDDLETDEKKCIQEDPMEVYEKIQADAVNLGNGDLSLNMDIIMKFLQVNWKKYGM